MRRIYDIIGIAAMIATPLAAAVLFGWNLYNYLIARSVPPFLAITGGIAGAVAIESVGIYAGHVAMDYIRRRDWRALIALAAMAFYVYVGWSKTPDYGVVFVLAAFVYVLVSLRSEAVENDTQQQATARADTNWQRRMELERERMKHDERLARIEAKARPDKADMSTGHKADKADMAGHVLSDRQLAVLDMLRQERTQADIAAVLGVSERTIRRDIVTLNGQVKNL